MVSTPSFMGTSSDGQPTFTIDQHELIPRPAFIPEIKWDEGFLAILNHRDALQKQNPIMVPAAAYPALRNKPQIVERTNDHGEEIGEKEVAELESNHPLLYFDPPELYNYRRTYTLRTYYFKGKRDKKKEFDSYLVDGQFDEALKILPAFQRAFFKANLDKVTAELSGAPSPSETEYNINSTDEAWSELEEDDMEGYFSEIAADASGRSAVCIPPVPVIRRRPKNSLVTALCSANSTMADVASNPRQPKSYFHLCITHTTLQPSGEDAGNLLLDIVRKELENVNYAGIVLTIRNPHKIDAAGSLARTETFIQNLCEIGATLDLPVIMARSGWLGTLATDNGVAAWSDMMNSAWEYTSSSGGPAEMWKKYGTVATHGDAKPLTADPDADETIIDYIQEGKISQFDPLPNEPPGNLAEGETLRQKLGSPREFRIWFAKPRKLSHIYEAKTLQENRQNGKVTPARVYLRESENPYLDV